MSTELVLRHFVKLTSKQKLFYQWVKHFLNTELHLIAAVHKKTKQLSKLGDRSDDGHLK